MDHRILLQLVIAYTLVGAFVFTVIVTCLSLVGWIKLANARQQNKLFSILIVELVVGCVGFFFNFLTVNPAPVVKEIGDRAVEFQKLVDGLVQQVDALPEDKVVALETRASTMSSADVNKVVAARDPANRRASDPSVARAIQR